MEEKVELKIVVDEEEIEANEFVQTVIGKVIAGAVSALKGVKEDWEQIEVTVKRI
jgi:hypothetical protein